MAMKLLSPLAIRRSTAPSRVMFGPHETNLATRRSPSERHVAYYERRALGGAGIIVVEEASVHPSDWPYERCPLAPDCGPGWRAIGEACHRHGALVLAALGHSGGQGTSHWSQREMWAPSAIPEVATREVPKVMEADDIDAVVAGFRAATRLAVECGLDGVEINVGQFSLIRQFLSGLTNHRDDAFGGDRSLFARTVLSAVREAAGEAIVGLRLSVDEMAPWAGIVPEAGVALAVEFAPYVDMITLVRGSIYTAWATRPDGHTDPGFGIDLARQVREGLHAAGLGHVLVGAQGSIVETGQAEWALDSGAADFAEMTRAQLADATLVAKLRAGKAAQIRPCVLCNQTCKVRDNRNPIITCVVDPRTGHELDDPAEPSEPPTPPTRPDAAASPGKGPVRRVTVVGAGIAGLECARTAALHGWEVKVIEQAEKAGGVIRATAAGAGRGRLSAIAEWLEAECGRHGVEITFGRAPSAAELGGEVIYATGGRHGPLPFAVDDHAVVVHAVDCLSGIVLPDGPVAVWDPLAGAIAISVAEKLAHEGRTVVFVTPDLLVGEKLSMTGDLAPAQNRLHGAGIVIVKRATVRRVTPSHIVVEDRFSGVTSIIEVGSLVACGHRVPGEFPPGDDARRIGDAVAPRTIHEAILEGRRAAVELGH